MARKQTVMRGERFTLLLSAEERRGLDIAAAATGMDRSTYIRARVFLDAPTVARLASVVASTAPDADQR